MEIDHGSETIAFSEAWPELSARLRRVLRSRRVPREFVDDLVQETGLRLYRDWDRVDQTTLWALANTIALNLVRDEMRKLAVREREPAARPAELSRSFDDEMLTRLELRRVEKVLQKMRPVDRQVLLAEWGIASEVAFASPAALKMARMRARKRLVAALEQGSAGLPLWRLREGWLNRNRNITPLSEQLSHVALAVFTAVAGAAASVIAQAPPSASESAATATVTSPTADVASLAEQFGHGRGASGDTRVTSTGASETADRSGGAERTASASEDDDLNENFGPIKADDGDVYIGEGSGLGPYGVDREVETDATGERSSARARATYEAPKCDGEIIIGGKSTYQCDGPGKASADAEAESHGQHHQAGTP